MQDTDKELLKAILLNKVRKQEPIQVVANQPNISQTLTDPKIVGTEIDPVLTGIETGRYKVQGVDDDRLRQIIERIQLLRDAKK